MVVDEEPLLAACNPATLACMHGSGWRGDGAGILRALAGA